MMRFPLAAFAILLIQCSDGPTAVAGGGGVETTGGDLVAMVGNAAGSSAAGARVRLVPAGYVPAPDSVFPESLTAFADDSGHYAFRNPKAGLYNLEAFLPKEGVRLLRRNIRVGTGAQALGRDTLRTPAKVDLIWAAAKPGILYVTGSTWSRTLPDEETMPAEYLLDSLPAGLLPPIRHRAASAPADTASEALTDTLLLEPGGLTRFVVFDGWAHTARLRINTTPAGADVPGAVQDFPLLVRLFAGDFNFAEAATGGRDLRFTDSNGVLLPFSIDRWDSAGGRAEIWVRVPRVEGNSDQNQVLMHWGRADAPAPGTGPVFSPASGFVAVWHLDESGNAAPGGYADATGSHPGTANAYIDTTHTEAVIVGGLKLDGAKYVAVPPAQDLDSLPALTLSLWCNADSWSGGDRTLLQKGASAGQKGASAGAGQYGLTGIAPGDSLEFRFTVDGVPHALRIPAPPSKELHQVQATFDGQEARLYLDGVLGNSLAMPGKLGPAADSLYLGQKPGGLDSDHFPGLLDEVEISKVARDAAWIKLGYETQKPSSKVVRLEPIQ